MSDKQIPARLDNIALGEDYGTLHALVRHVEDDDRREELHDVLVYSWNYLVNPSLIVFPDGQTLLERLSSVKVDEL